MNDHHDQEVLSPNDVMNEQSLAVALESAAIDMQIATAHKYPRSLDTVIKKIRTMACYNEASAETCIYSLPRGGKPILGPSIGLANIVATSWGNCADGSRWVATDRKEKVVVAEGVFHDYETNRKVIVSEQRRIVTSKGHLFTDDMIIVTSKAAGSIARRNAIFQVIPRMVWHPIYEECLAIVRGTEVTFAERKDKALKAFSQFGVTPDQVFMWLGLKGEIDLNLEHLPLLRGGYVALRDGSTTVEEMFDPRRMTGKGFEQINNPLADDLEDQTPVKPAAPAEPHDPDTGELDAPPAEAAPARTAKPAKKSKAKASAAESHEQVLDQEQIEPLKEPPKPEVESPPEPRTTEEYKAYWQAILMGSTNGTALDQRWKSPRERALRGNCGVIEDDMVSLRNATTQRIAELGA